MDGECRRSGKLVFHLLVSAICIEVRGGWPAARQDYNSCGLWVVLFDILGVQVGMFGWHLYERLWGPSWLWVVFHARRAEMWDAS